jgi:tetratricopeptide (TPR) repeat protein
MTAHGRASDYLDGVLDAEQEAAFLDHLARCEDCQRELGAEVQLRDREDAVRGGPSLDQHPEHGRAGEYLDGALAAERAAAFLEHLAVCGLCEHDLHDEVQLRDREDALRNAGILARQAGGSGDGRDPGAKKSAGSPARSRLRRWTGWLPVAAVAAVAVLLVGRVIRPPSPIALIAEGTARPVEVRFAAVVAAAYRPYSPNRGSGASPSASISPSIIADLDRSGDCPGVAAAYALDGQLTKADARYRECKARDARAEADLEADRAGIAVLRNQFEAALELTQQVIDEVPDHAVAWWNRALAERALGLDLSAVASFERAAAIDRATEPRWAHDATERAEAMGAEAAGLRKAYDDVIRLGFQMVGGGPPIALTLARQVPGRARVMLHDAIRTATTAARLDELAPLSTELEKATGANLGRYLVDARSRLSPEHTAAAEGYAEIVKRFGRIDDRAWDSWLALATRAHDDDLILGARILTRRLDGRSSAEQLAAATGDPWFVLGVELKRAAAAREGGRVLEATERLRAIEDHCSSTTPGYRCLQLEAERAKLALDLHQPPAANHHAMQALALSRRFGDWQYRSLALTLAADAERFDDAVSVARAYYEESGRSLDDPCGMRNQAFAVAGMLFRRHQIAPARAQLSRIPTCKDRSSTVELTVLARLLRVGQPVMDRATLAAEIASARNNPELERDAPYLDYLAAWIDLDGDPSARARLLAAADSARRIEGSMREKTLAAIDNALFADAGRREAWSEALAVVARAHGVPPPSRCALAFGADDTRFVAIVVAADGTTAGDYRPDVAHATEWLAPRRLQDKLAGCDEVAVLSLSPWLGIGPVLDAAMPWHYVLGPAPTAASGHRRVVVANPAIPPEAGLPALAPRTWPDLGKLDELITGAAATPERVLASIADASLVEIHSHGTLERLGSPVIALANGAGGWTLGVEQIRSARLTGAPVVVLADCSGGVAAQFEHEAEGLPLAFRAAGASAVIASLADIPDREAGAFFDAVISQISAGASPAKSVARVRAEKMQGDPTSWMRHVVVFQ